MAAPFLAILASACASPPKPVRPDAIALETRPTEVRVLADDEHFATIRMPRGEDTAIVELLAPGERHVLRGFPRSPRGSESRDHPEHRGLWTGHGDVDGVDTWTSPERVTVRSDEVRLLGSRGAEVALALDWSAEDGSLLCDERRTLRFASIGARRTVDVTHELRAPRRGVRFGDVKEGFFAAQLAGEFHLQSAGATRIVSDMNGDAPGTGVDDDPWGQNARWIATIGQLPTSDGTATPVTVALFDHPRNHGHPVRWHVRGYGLVAANPFGESAFERDGGPRLPEGGLALRPYGTTTLRFRLVVADGALTAEALEAEWRDFAGLATSAAE